MIDASKRKSAETKGIRFSPDATNGANGGWGTGATGRLRVIMVGPTSTPVCGRTVVTRDVLGLLQGGGVPFTLFNVSLDTAQRNRVGLWNKLRAYVKAAIRGSIIARREPVVLYTSLESTTGLYLDCLIAACIGRQAARVICHHHSHTYLERWDWRMALLIRISGGAALHVVQCDLLAARLKQLYSGAKYSVALSNAAWVKPRPGGGSAAERKGLVLGHLSNLAFNKGLGTVLSVLRQALSDGLDVRLILAGGASSCDVRQVIEGAIREFGGRVEWRGAVYGSDKDKFYSDIDVFLFPTKSRTETEGIVTLEAMAAGVPVIAFKRACIEENIGDGAGIGVDPSGDFVGVAVDYIGRWAMDQSELRAIGGAAARRAAALFEQGQRQLDALRAALSMERK